MTTKTTKTTETTETTETTNTADLFTADALASVKGVITRTAYVVRATAVKLEIKDGTPTMTTITSDPYVVVNPEDKAAAKRAVKAIDKRIALETVQTEVLAEQVYSMDLSDYFTSAKPVERGANGRVKNS